MNVMTYKGYTTSMEYDAIDKILVGKLLGIRDRVAFHGDSIATFEAMFHESVDGYIDDCRQLGKAPEKPASGRLMLRVTPSVHCAALAAARASGQSLNQWASAALASAAGT
ncbi:MAG: type II toxin-antitoxin system HicB family antitoxin [Pseudomonadales bacterium]|jgi:predicted HicB family RNase H-like nuclease|nr:type II toxin-antitoxin system HicB family antitoxin [Pseudomonadales bacterium]